VLDEIVRRRCHGLPRPAASTRERGDEEAFAVAAVALLPEHAEHTGPRVGLTAAAELAELVHVLEHQAEQLVARHRGCGRRGHGRESNESGGEG
jgi:hypothetical protein